MKNPYAEAISALFSGKSLKPVIVWIAQNNPGVLVKAFKACYPEPVPVEIPKFDAVITRAENDARILTLARTHRVGAIKLHREIYHSTLQEARDEVVKMLQDDGSWT